MTKMGKKKTLIVSKHAEDAHVHQLVAELTRRGHPWVICDPGDVPAHVQFSARIGSMGTISTVDAGSNRAKQSFLLQADGTRIMLEEISSVWYRRPTPMTAPTDVTGMEKMFIEREAIAGVWGWLRGLRAFWVNHPDAIRAAGYKPEQLQRAASLGLDIPRSLITNEPDAFLRFYEECNGSVVFKLMGYPWYSDSNDVPISSYTSLVPHQMLEEAHRIRATTHLFQEFLVKQCDLRAIVIGNDVFTTAIYPLSEDARVDFRADYAHLRYESYALPDHTRDALLALAHSYQLAYAAIDLLLTPDGRSVFLEVNPVGQFGWLEGRTGVPLYQTLATLLIEGGCE